MQNLVQAFENYLFENLFLSPHLVSWDEGKKMPFFLRDGYSFYECELLSQPWLVMVTQKEEEVTPVTVRKHIAQVQKKWRHDVIYLSSTLSSYNRKRFIEQKIPFVVPGNQMYLPTLGVDLREHVRSLRSTKIKKISPSTQAVVLSLLYDWPQNGVTPSQLAAKLGYTAMTMTRAFDEVESIGVVDINTESRERVLRISNEKKTVWEKCLPYLRSPVRKRAKVLSPYKQFDLLLAGELALSRNSLLVEPSHLVYAVSGPLWKTMQRKWDISELTFHDTDSVVIEVWKYPPDLFARNKMVDPLSLYLSLKETSDEREEIALVEMMEKFSW